MGQGQLQKTDYTKLVTLGKEFLTEMEMKRNNLDSNTKAAEDGWNILTTQSKLENLLTATNSNIAFSDLSMTFDHILTQFTKNTKI